MGGKPRGAATVEVAGETLAESALATDETT
jgi:hypothetical protein